MKIFILLFVLVSSVFAAPPDFKIPGGKAVFVDFDRVLYDLSINPGGSFSWVNTTIELEQKTAGHILLDFRHTPTEIKINGKRIDTEVFTAPNKKNKFLMLSQKTAAGRHVITMKSKLEFSLGGKRDIYFKMRDLYGWFLDRYLPTNLEFDQYQMEMKVRLNIKDADKYRVMSNALVSQYDEEKKVWSLTFPSHLNTSSIFFHLLHSDSYSFLQSSYTTAQGRVIPLIIYGPHKIHLASYEDRAREVMLEMEQEYGEYPHHSLVIYARGGKGGMEYAGATETSLRSLGHEIFHCYFGRGVMPANGNAGALDEGLASWRDYDYFSIQLPNFKKSDISGHPLYTKNTDKRAYKLGRQFFGYLDYKLQDQGGLRPFLRLFFQKHVFKTVTMEQFRDELNDYSGMNFHQDFERYLF